MKSPHESTGHDSKWVLLVDDNRDGGRMLTLTLTDGGHDIRTAFDEAEALEVAQTFTADAVSPDLGMPLMNGYKAARRLRETPAWADVMLAAMTGFGEEEDRQSSAEARFDHHLFKPADYAAVQALL